LAGRRARLADQKDRLVSNRKKSARVKLRFVTNRDGSTVGFRARNDPARA
jgi:hypothetical protein